MDRKIEWHSRHEQYKNIYTKYIMELLSVFIVICHITNNQFVLYCIMSFVINKKYMTKWIIEF